MPAFKSSHVEVYAFRRRRGRVEFLVLRRARHRPLPGVWQPITGSVRPAERATDAALRELKEETGQAPLRMWALETPTVFFDAVSDTIEALPLFAAELDPAADVTLCHEHDAHAFVSARDAGRRFLWDAQRRGLEAVLREVLGNETLAAALEVTRRPTPTPLVRRRARH